MFADKKKKKTVNENYKNITIAMQILITEAN